MNPSYIPCRVSAEERRYDCERCEHGVREDEHCQDCAEDAEDARWDDWFSGYAEE